MKHTNIVASYLILFRGKKVLLLQRCNTGYHDGDFSLIAGHVEPGETFTDTIIREAKEEAGITVKRAWLTVAHIMHRRSDHDDTERVDAFFVAKKWEGEITNQELNKCSQLKWFEINRLPKNTIDCVRQAIECVDKQIPYSEFGW